MRPILAAMNSLMRPPRIGTLIWCACIFCPYTAHPATLTEAQADLGLLCKFPELWPGEFGDANIVCRDDILQTFTDAEAIRKTQYFWGLYTDEAHSKEHLLAMLKDRENRQLAEKQMQQILAEKERKNAEIAAAEIIAQEQATAAEEAARAQAEDLEAKKKKEELLKRQAETQRRQYAIDHPPEQTLASMDIYRVCQLYRRVKSPEALAEIKRRKVFWQKEIELILAHQVGIGMRQAALECSWGLPDKRNRTVTAYSEDIQWIYGEVYVYTENGVVRSWQD